ncbi:MAG TPA: ATP-binding protein [Candidatus Sulfomarinibacteraceae bacterium]|nr:ATP-binding protein [Candidatus Sulfomarinibacteraceae bacterium]
MSETANRSLNRTIDWFQASPWRLLVMGVGVALIVAVAAMFWLMEPPLAELAALVRTLFITSVLSLALGFVLYRRGLTRLPSLSLTLALAYGWVALVILVNVLVMAGLMFVSEHDLALSLVLMLFAAIIAMTYGLFVSSSVADGLRELAQTARAVARGKLDARVPVTGRDEVAQAAVAFNEMAEQLEAAARQRTEVDKLRQDLIAWTSHDLRTPLTSIRAMVEALHDGIVSDEETVHRYYRTIRADVVALNRLIDDLFELAQLEAGGLPLERAQHSLSDLISDALESFQALAQERDVRLDGDVSGTIDPVFVNAPRVSRLLNNLIVNAIQFTPAGGRVRVRARPAGEGVTITVEDSGPGFAEGDLPRVFEQFYRGEEARSRASGGAGLGLAIAHAIVEAHGGFMRAENRDRGGARLTVYLPRMPQEHAGD